MEGMIPQVLGNVAYGFLPPLIEGVLIILMRSH